MRRLSRLWIFALVIIVASALTLLTLTHRNSTSVNDANVIAVAYLPSQFTVNGPLAKLLYAKLNRPIGSVVSASELIKLSGVRLAWHMDYLTIVLGNGSKVTIEAKTQVIQVKVGGAWLTIEPPDVKPGYSVRVVKGNETLNWLISIATREARPIVPPIPAELMSHFAPGKLSLVIPPQAWPSGKLNKSSGGGSGDPTWALSTFTYINDSGAICGYAYPINNSDLVIPVSDYAVVPLSIYQKGYASGNYFVALIIQAALSIWPPELVENVWVNTTGGVISGNGIGLLSYAYMPLASPIDWLVSGATLCIYYSQSSGGAYQITLVVMVNGVNYTEAQISETNVGSGYYTITVTPGENFQPNAGAEITLGCDPVYGSVSSPLDGITLYPSLAFETNDTSPSLMNSNDAFALEFKMGSSTSNAYNGEWPLFYSISGDFVNCSGIWGSSGIGSTWPPVSSVQWGAGGLTIEYPGEPNTYVAAVGSISQIINGTSMRNTIGIACNYVDTNLTTLNT